MSGNNQKVGFLLIGAARSATTSLSSILSTHQDICFSKPKEPQFFSDPDWRNSLNDYNAMFNRAGKLRGEGSTNYSKYPAFNQNIHRDIYEYNPEMKILYMLRHPIDRLKSHYRFSIERGLTTDTLEQALQLNPIYVNTSKYFSQIQPYIDLFGRDQVHLIFFEDFKNEPEKTVHEIWDFLEIDPHEKQAADLHLNKSGDGQIGHIKFDNPKGCLGKTGKILHATKRILGLRKPSYDLEMSSNLRRRLKKEFESEIDEIEKLSGRDLSQWREF